MSGTLVAMALYLLGMPIGWIMPEFSPTANMKLERCLLALFWPLFSLIVIWIVVKEALQPLLPFNPRNYEDEDI